MIKHRELNKREQQELLDLYQLITDNDFIMKKMRANKYWSLLFLAIITSLFALTMITYKSVQHLCISIILGLLSIQLNFIMGHMAVHALMLDYSLWNRNMIQIVGDVPPVVPIAFYHHHEFDRNCILSYDNVDGEFNVMVSHWVSFSLFTSYFPINGYLLKAFIALTLRSAPAYYLGYEIGVILLPIAHAWVHSKIKSSNVCYIIKMLEYIGIVASKQDHKKHHDYNGEYVYTSFTTSGIYSATLDEYMTNIWNYLFIKCREYDYPLYKVLLYLHRIVMFITIVFSMYILI